MSEQEALIKHTKNAYKVWNSKDHSFWHKLKEFLIEIAIIVFAVSLSIWFHGRSEHKHQQADVKEFLIGLRSDLTNDIKEMTADSVSYREQLAAFQYLTSIKYGEVLNPDSVRKHSDWIFNMTGLVPNNGRFEGFKSSGKVGQIEDKELQTEILDLYQENIPMLLNSTNLYAERKRSLHEYIAMNFKRNKQNTYNVHEVLSTDPALNIGTSLVNTVEINDRYAACMAKSRYIIARIEQLYPGLPAVK